MIHKKRCTKVQSQHGSNTSLFLPLNDYKDLYGYSAKVCDGLHYEATLFRKCDVVVVVMFVHAHEDKKIIQGLMLEFQVSKLIAEVLGPIN